MLTQGLNAFAPSNNSVQWNHQ